MVSIRYLSVGAATAVLFAGSAEAVPVSFTQLTGVTGGTIAATGVFKADLSGLGLATVAAISITDNSGGVGGASGQFSGFDLDAIILSTTNCATAACAAGLVPISVFDYPNAAFTQGTQRPPPDPQLFGTGPGGTSVDDAVATLGVFDGESTTAIPGADGFISMGDGGNLLFNLTAGVSTTGLFLYIGEVGDNGEVAAGDIQVFDTPQRIPEPGMLALFGIGLAGLGWLRRRSATPAA